MSGEHPAPTEPGAGRTVPSAGSTRVLLAILVLIGAIAVGGGAAGVVLGAVTSGDEQEVAVSTSSEYRFLSGVWLALGLVLWCRLAAGRGVAGTT